MLGGRRDRSRLVKSSVGLMRGVSELVDRSNHARVTLLYCAEIADYSRAYLWQNPGSLTISLRGHRCGVTRWDAQGDLEELPVSMAHENSTDPYCL